MATSESGEKGNEHVILEFFSGIGGMRYAAETWASAGSADEQRKVEVPQAFEVSSVANTVYAHNFGDKPCNRSIEHLDVKLLDSFKADTWLMSPPCQPYTSMGLKKDSQDPRARALLHLCEVLPKLAHPPSYILLENVNNFQKSDSRDIWLAALASTGYIAHEFLLSPSQLNIPNERLRYYCLARREGKDAWDASLCGQILRYVPDLESVRPGIEEEGEGEGEREGEGEGEGKQEGEEGAGREREEEIQGEGGRGEVSEREREEGETCGEPRGEGGSSPQPSTTASVAERNRLQQLVGEKKKKKKGLVYVDLNSTRAEHYQHCRQISDYLDDPAKVDLTQYMIPDEELMKWKGYVFDIVTPESRRCSCFTKSYNKYIRGTGSLLSSNFYGEDGKCLLDLKDPWCMKDLESMRQLKLRYFTETEVGRLMGFPVDRFSFPPLGEANAHAGFRLLGNSLNVLVVAALLEHLYRARPSTSKPDPQ